MQANYFIPLESGIRILAPRMQRRRHTLKL